MLKKKGLFILSFTCFFILLHNNAISQTVKKLKTIVVDAGHGGTDAGATGTYEHSLRSKEKDITLAIAKKLVTEFSSDLRKAISVSSISSPRIARALKRIFLQNL